MNAKSIFREGYILLLRSFTFAELDRAIPKHSILYAYVNEILYKDTLTEEGKQAYADMVNHAHFNKKLLFEQDEEFQTRMSMIQEQFDKDKRYHKKELDDVCVQCSIDGVECNFYGDEYKVLSIESYSELMQDDAYTVKAISNSVFNQKEIKDKVFYLRSRGISEHKAKRFASFGLKELAWYIPHPELQKLYCRPHEIVYTPEFEDYYADVYGSYENFLKTVS